MKLFKFCVIFKEVIGFCTHRNFHIFMSNSESSRYEKFLDGSLLLPMLEEIWVIYKQRKAVYCLRLIVRLFCIERGEGEVSRRFSSWGWNMKRGESDFKEESILCWWRETWRPSERKTLSLNVSMVTTLISGRFNCNFAGIWLHSYQ